MTFLTDLLGEYVPLMDGSGVVLPDYASIDFGWIANAVIFICFVIFLLRLMLIFLKAVLNGN